MSKIYEVLISINKRIQLALAIIREIKIKRTITYHLTLVRVVRKN